MPLFPVPALLALATNAALLAAFLYEDPTTSALALLLLAVLTLAMSLAARRASVSASRIADVGASL
ncbi:MAG: hypothetical protein JWO65_377 [Sphingomonas bacterium]|jgi:APA family basic amino acid/polyamine antiporter|nr:hypothetical protein [Sphingomonas bacterium]